MNQYSSFFTALKKLPGLSKEEAVYDFTNGRTRSLRLLSPSDVTELTNRLTVLAGSPKPQPKEPAGGETADRMRKKIIKLFYKKNNANTDAERKAAVKEAIAWAEKQGAKGIKKRFNDYTTGDLHILIGIAEKIYDDFLKSVRSKVQNKMKP